MRRRVGIVVGVVALVLAGCGRGSTNIEVRTVPRARITNAAAASAASASSRLVIDIEVSADGESVSFGGEGVQTLGTTPEEQLGVLTLDMFGLGEAEARVLGRDMYYDFSDIEGFDLPSGVSWVHMNYDDLVATLPEEDRASAKELFDEQSQYDASQYLDYLKNISSEVEEVGTEEVRGVATTRYRLQLDMEKFSEELSAQIGIGAVNQKQRKTQEAVVDAFESVETEVWVDDAGRLVRMEMEYDFSDIDLPDAPDDLTMKTTMEMFEFGVPVEVQAPPAEETVEFAELLAEQAD